MSCDASPLQETSPPVGEVDSNASRPLRLDDMPEEILLEITEYLLHAPHHTPVRHPQPLTEAGAKYYTALLTLQHRRDVISLSSCCKWMRPTVFGRCMPEVLNVKLCEKELSILSGLPKEIRDHVNYLRIKSACKLDEVTDKQYSFIDFIRLFKNIRKLDIYWTPFAPADPRLRGLKAAIRTDEHEVRTTTRSKNPCPQLVDLDIRTIDTCEYEVSDREKIEQSRYVLQQLRLPSVKIFYFTLGSTTTIHTKESVKLWALLVRAFKQCQFPRLEKVRWDIRDLEMNDTAIAIDLCDAVANMFRNCFRFASLKDVSCNLYANGQPGDSYKLWSVARTNDEDGAVCQAWRSPPGAVQRLVRAVKDGRPRLARLHLQTEWTISTPDGHQTGAGMWIVDYPPLGDASKSPDESASEGGDDDGVTLLPLGDELIKVTVLDSSFHMSCDEHLRAIQAGNQRGQRRRAVRGGHRARRTAAARP